MGDFTREVAVRRSREMKALPLILAVPLALAGLHLSGCENEDATGPWPAGQTVQVTLSAGAARIAPGDSTSLRATVMEADGSTPAQGRTVLFSEMLNKHSGSYAKTSAVTDASGEATNVFRADPGAAGPVTLKATVEGQAAYAELLVSAAPPSSLVLAISSASGASAIPADGRSELQLQVTAMRGGQPAANLEIELEAAPLGLLSATSLTTGDAGTTEWFRLIAAPEAGTTTVTARAEGVSGTMPVQFHPTSLQVAVVPAALELMADGISTTEVTVVVSGWDGEPMRGVIVRLAAGESFEDLDGDGEFTPGVDRFIDDNGNGSWDAIGRIDSYGTTREDGTLRATYTAGTEPRQAWIRASVSGGGQEHAIRLVPVPRAGRVEIRGDASSVYANGRSTIEGEVFVRDRNGTPLAGKRVTLVAGEPFDDVDGDGLFTPGVDLLLDDLDGDGSWSAIGSVEETVLTAAGGAGAFTYQAGLLVGTIAVKATVDGVGADLPIELTSLPPASRVTLAADYPEITVFGGGGIDNVAITATCYDILDDTVPAGVPVHFAITTPNRGGETLAEAVEGVYTATTREDGRATAVLVAGTTPGLVEIRATAGSVQRTVQVNIVSGAPHMVVLHAADDILTFWAETEVCAHVKDVHNNPVRDGIAVRFTVDEGMIEGADGSGRARRAAAGPARPTTASARRSGPTTSPRSWRRWSGPRRRAISRSSSRRRPLRRSTRSRSAPIGPGCRFAGPDLRRWPRSSRAGTPSTASRSEPATRSASGSSRARREARTSTA